MTECEKMTMFIEDNPEIAIKFMIWEDKILKQDNNGTTDVTNIDFDIID